MPESVPLAALIIGAVLLLLALTGGGFEIFGAKMPGPASPAIRGVAGLAGVALIVIGLSNSFGSGSAASGHSSGTASEAAATGSDAASVSTASTPRSTRFASESGASDATPPASSASTDLPNLATNVLPAGVVSDTNDSVQIVAIEPAPGTSLQRGSVRHFAMTVKYSLQSHDDAILAISTAQIRASVKGCDNDGNLTDATEIHISRGIGTVNLDVKWSGDDPAVSKQAAYGTGYISFVPSIWQYVNGRRAGLIKSFGIYKQICMSFGP
jgi:hypothetical protein